MKISKFMMLIEQIDSDNSLKNSTILADTFRYWERKWYDRNGIVVSDLPVIDMLSRTRKTEKPAGHGNISYYYVKKFDAVVRCQTKASPKDITKQKINSNIQRCADRASDKFDANHTSLTGLLNRNNFISICGTEIKYAKDRIKNGSNKYEISSSLNIAIFSIDIDKFKQINDTHTHQYGDVVLKCVASRIEDTCSSLQIQSSRELKIVCAHPSGEEFLVLVANCSSRGEIIEIAESIRSAIFSEPLPSDREWVIMSKGLVSDTFSRPDESHRRVAISVGVSVFNISDAEKEEAEIVAKMLGRADIALQRSKAGGRNRVTDFSDILGNHGRVINCYPETGVVCIDIGLSVGVPSRQEFWVYEERFYKGDNVYINDGRTNRKIGNFPKRPCGRIVAFDVQNEISFCTIEKRHGTVDFSVGNVVTPVPIGSIGHLFYQNHDEDMFSHEIFTYEKFKEVCDIKFVKDSDIYVYEVFNENEQYNEDEKHDYDYEEEEPAIYDGNTTVISVHLMNVSDIVTRRGTSYVNKILASIYIKVREFFGDDSVVSQFDSCTFRAPNKRAFCLLREYGPSPCPRSALVDHRTVAAAAEASGQHRASPCWSS